MRIVSLHLQLAENVNARGDLASLITHSLHKLLSLILDELLLPVSVHKGRHQTLICLRRLNRLGVSQTNVKFLHLVLILASAGTGIGIPKYITYLPTYFLAFFHALFLVFLLALLRGQILIEVSCRVVKRPVAVVVLNIVRL